MGIYSYDDEFRTPVPPHRLFRAYAVDGDNLIPKLAPYGVTSNPEILEGDGGPGTIKKIHLGEGAGLHFKFMKHKVEYIDKEKFGYRYSLIEGEGLFDKLEKITYDMKFLETPERGCVVKTNFKFFIKAHGHITHEHVKLHEEKFYGVLKAVETHLVAHPDEYI